MTKKTTKTKEEKAELNPLSKEQFEDLYNKAWENGWVYGKFFQELYYEYLVNWVYFIVYLDKLKMKTPENVEILIGEAPPYCKGNAKNNEKSYFYNPAQTKNSPWLNRPFIWKGGKLEDTKINPKQKKLEFLAKKGIVLIDIFPFPIIQDSAVRTEITGGYADHIRDYFLKKYSEIINYIRSTKKITFTHGLVATELGALQFLCDKTIFKLREYNYIVDNPINFEKFTNIKSWIENIVNINPSEKNNTESQKIHLKNHYNFYKGDFIPIVKSSKDEKTDWSDKLNFVRKLLEHNEEIIGSKKISEILMHITKLPIFMKGQNVEFNDFINGRIE